MSPSPTRRPSATVRQAIGVFHDSTALEEAVSELQSHGFDRAEISLVSGADDPQAALHLPGEAARPGAPQAGLSDTDLRQGRVLGTSMAGSLAGLAAAGFVVATGGTALVAIGAAVAAAAAGGVLGEVAGKAATSSVPSFNDAEAPGAGGVFLLVHVRDRAAEARALEVLHRRSASHVSVQDLPASQASG